MAPIPCLRRRALRAPGGDLERPHLQPAGPPGVPESPHHIPDDPGRTVADRPAAQTAAGRPSGLRARRHRPQRRARWRRGGLHHQHGRRSDTVPTTCDRSPNHRALHGTRARGARRRVPVRHADAFPRDHLSPFLNHHRACFFAVEGANGRRRRKYPQELVMTPYEKLRSLPGADGSLKPGITFERARRPSARHDRPGGCPGGPAGPQGALPAHRQRGEPRNVIGPARPSARSARLGSGGPLSPPSPPTPNCLPQPLTIAPPARALPPAPAFSCPGWNRLWGPAGRCPGPSFPGAWLARRPRRPGTRGVQSMSVTSVNRPAAMAGATVCSVGFGH